VLSNQRGGSELFNELEKLKLIGISNLSPPVLIEYLIFILDNNNVPVDERFNIKLPIVVTERPWLPARFRLNPVDLYLEFPPPLVIVESFNCPSGISKNKESPFFHESPYFKANAVEVEFQ
jgi:hypothetical protein